MKKVKRRTLSLVVLVIILIGGMGVFIFRMVRDGMKWASFPSNHSVFTDGVLASGKLTDRNGVILADIADGQRVYADDYEIRQACLHVVGDTSGNIGSGALSAFAARLIGYNFVNGTYSLSDKGKTIELAVDSELNRVAYEALDGRKGTVAICNYETGEIICNVSTPTYDPYDPPEDMDSEEYDGVYLNRLISADYTPGSVFKIITLAAAIENMDDLFERTFYCEGSFELGPDEVICTGYHGEQTIEEAFANSCNCAFGKIALELGGETLSKYAEKYGLTGMINIDEINSAAGNFDIGEKDTADLAWSGIGQYNDTVTPVAMLRLVSAIANGGEAPSLTMLKQEGLKKLSGVHTERIMPASTAQELDEMMAYNVVYGYGEENYPGLNLHAKSGTAEVGTDKSPHAWFVGYIDNKYSPYAFVVIVENGGWGSATAGAIANTVLQAAVDR